MSPRRAATSLLIAAAAAMPAGCQQDDPRLQKLREELRQSTDRAQQLEQNRLLLSRKIDQQHQLIARLRGLDGKRLEHLFVPVDIELNDFSAGVDLDDEPGDDGVRIRMVPTDAAGTPIKAAGSVTIRLFDLAAEPDSLLVGEREIPVERIGEHWSGHFGTFHFAFEVPFAREPEHEEITVRAAFLDYLTGRVFTAQQVVQVELAPDDGGGEDDTAQEETASAPQGG